MFRMTLYLNCVMVGKLNINILFLHPWEIHIKVVVVLCLMNIEQWRVRQCAEAFFNSILSQKAVSQYLVLKVRRDCLVEDSLRSVSEVVWSSQQEIKKGLRIEFTGEEGVDAGGLRKEWFLLLVREVFDSNHGKQAR